MNAKLRAAIKVYELLNNDTSMSGFVPADYITVKINEKGEPYTTMDLNYQYIWFKRKNPEGRVVKEIIEHTKEYCLMEARVYKTREQDEDDFDAHAFSEKFFEEGSEYGNKFLEMAETACEARVLLRAGYGFPTYDGDLFADMAEANSQDPTLPDFVKPDAAPKGAAEDKAVNKEEDTDKEQKSVDKVSGNKNSKTTEAGTDIDEDQISITDNPMQDSLLDMANKLNGNSDGIKEDVPYETDESNDEFDDDGEIVEEQEDPDGHNIVDEGPKYDKNTPVEEILKYITEEEARAYEVPAGFNKGKSLGYVVDKKPNQLKWIIEMYDGKDNIAKAAAKLLYDQAKSSNAA